MPIMRKRRDRRQRLKQRNAQRQMRQMRGKNKMTQRYCPFCEDELTFNKNGTMNGKDGKIKAIIYLCEECDQAFGVGGSGTIGVLPYDSDMKPIEEYCKTCDKKEVFRQNMIMLLNREGCYEPYCIDCAIEFLRNWSKKEKKDYPSDNITKENVHALADIYDFTTHNKILQNPKLLSKVQKNIDEKIGGQFQ